MADRSMAIKHAKAKKEAIKEVMNKQNDFAQTTWAKSESVKKWMSMNPYTYRYVKHV